MLNKGKARAEASASTGETSQLVQGEGDAPTHPPSDVSALYIPSNSANNLLPYVFLSFSDDDPTLMASRDADYFKRRLSMASNADTLKLECALVDSAIDLLNKSVHSTGAGLDLLETRGNSVSQVAMTRARSLVAREVMQKGFPAAQQL